MLSGYNQRLNAISGLWEMSRTVGFDITQSSIISAYPRGLLIREKGITKWEDYLLMSRRNKMKVVKFCNASLAIRSFEKNAPFNDNKGVSKYPRGKPRGIKSAASKEAAQALALVRDDAEYTS